MELIEVEISKIEIPDVRVTSSFPEEVLEQFRLSIATVGVIQPIHVLQEGERLILVDGLHRLQEAQGRGETTIKAVVQAGTLKEVLIQNLLTSGLHGKPKASELRKVIASLTVDYGMDSIEIRRKTGLSQDYIERLQWINRAIPDVQLALDEEAISVGHAAMIARIDRTDVQERVLFACLQNRMTVPTLKHHIELVQQILANPTAYDAPTPIQEVRKARCSGCRDDYPIEDLATYSLCPSCSASLYEARRVHDAVRSITQPV